MDRGRRRRRGTGRRGLGGGGREGKREGRVEEE